MVVWKVVTLCGDGENWSGVFNGGNRKFPFDTLVKNNEKKNVNWADDYPYVTVGRGFFHSYRDRADAVALKEHISMVSSSVYGSMYEKMPDYVRTAVVKCVIPKGTECYWGQSRDFASRSIIVANPSKKGDAL